MIDQISPIGAHSVGPVGGASRAAATGATGAAGATAGAGDFSAVLSRMITEATDTLRASEAASIAGVKGQATVQQVVEHVMAAEQTLQAAIAIRDKVTAAYLELGRMQI